MPGSLFASFRHPGFGLLWASISLNGYANHISTVGIGWLALEFTGSPLGVGLAIATRNLPRLLLSVPFGSLSDRMDRRVLLQVTNLAGAGVSVLAAFASLQGWFAFTGVIAIAVFVGIFDVAETTLAKAYVYDVVGARDALNGMSLEQLANKLFGVVGGVTSGLLLAFFGGGGVFFAMSVAYLLSAGMLVAIGRAVPDAGARAVTVTQAEEGPPPIGLWAAMRELLRSPTVALFALVALAAEVLAYSSEVLLPSFARDVLAIGETGLGNLVAVRNGGGVIGLLLLATLGRRHRPDRLLLTICITFGGGLTLFAAASSYSLALLTIALVGAAWASVDALLPTVLQQQVTDSQRGAVVGIWNLGRGFGPAGQLEIGLLGATIGVVATQAVNGVAFAAVALVAAVLHRRRERAAGCGLPEEAL